MKASYTVKDRDLILDSSEKEYVLKVRDLAPEEKPREKLTKYGPELLSTSELLAVLLGVGTKKEEVLNMSSRLVKEYGKDNLMSHKDVKTLSKDLDIPLGKAAQIVASAELGRRFFEKNTNGKATIRNAKDVFGYVKDMRDLAKEHLRGIYLNTRHQIIHDEVISIGTVNSNIVHPREVFQPAISYSAVALVLVHNHPSGSTKASKADVEVTKQLIDAGRILGIDLLDHVIVTKNRFASIALDYD